MKRLVMGILKIIGTLSGLYSAFLLLINAFANIDSPGYRFDTGQLLIWVAGTLVLFELVGLWIANRMLGVVMCLISIITILITWYVELNAFDVPDISTIVGVVILGIMIWLLTFFNRKLN